MEDRDGNQYLFDFPPETRLPDLAKHAVQGLKRDTTGKPLTAYVYSAEEVAAHSGLRQAWFTAQYQFGIARDGRRLYLFTFPNEKLVELGLLPTSAK